MSITLKVAGVDRSTFVSKVQPAGYNDTLNGRGTGSIVFNVPFDQLATFRPIDGQTILIEEDLGGGPVARFGGFLVEPEALELLDEEYVIFSCGMQDNNAIADRRTINATFDEIAFEDIVDAIVSNASNDGLTGESITQTGVVAGAAISLDFPTIYVTEAFNDLAVAAGGSWWNIGHDKDLSFAPRTAVPAPGDLTGANTLKKTVKVRPVKEKYRNVEIVFGGKDDFTITAMFEDTTEIAARAALEGGTSGRYEHIEERQDILDSVLVEELAEDLVTRFGLVTLMFECVTRDPGYASGQEVDVTFPNLELNAETFLIDSVSAQLVYTSEDGSDTEEIWYTISAITGDPFGGWMEHFRKRPGSSQERKIVPAPGVTVECDPGVVVHDPIPGPFDWFQAATSVPTEFPNTFGVTPDGTKLLTLRVGGLANTGGCGGPNPPFPGIGGAPACFANRQVFLEGYVIAADNVVGTIPDFAASTDQLNTGANFKPVICISPDSGFALIIQTDAGSGDAYVYDISQNAFVGSVASTMLNNSNLSEPVWVGDVCYFIDATSGTIFMYDISDPTTPAESTFATSLTLGRSLVASPDGSVLYGCGGTKVVALDISSPLAPVEDTVLTISEQRGLDINDGGTALVMCFRHDASNVRVLPVSMSLNGTDIVLGTISILPHVSTIFHGLGMVWRGDSAICWSQTPGSPSNSLRALVLDMADPNAATILETLSYNHGISANQGPFRSQESAKVYFFFGGVTQQITFGVQTFPVCKDLETQFPLEEDFGGTGHKRYTSGDILVATGETTLARVPAPNDDEVLVGDAAEPAKVKWADISAGPSGASYVLRSLMNGTFRETFDALVTSDGATVTMSLEQSGGGDLSMQFSDDVRILICTPALTIALTTGSDMVPTENYIYILQSDSPAVLTKSTSHWPAPTIEHIKVGFFFVPSAGRVQTKGVSVNQNWNDHLQSPGGQGHISHLAERSRLLGAIYHSGVVGNGTTEYVTIVTNGGTPDNVFVKTTAGVLFQLHEHTYPAMDTSAADEVLVPNHSATPYLATQDLADLLTDATGASMAGKYFNFVLMGVLNKAGEFAPMLINVPGGSYNKQSDAEQDVSGYDVFVIPAAFHVESSTGFLISRITLKHSAASGGTWTHISTLDLRGLTPVGAAGGSTGVTTTEFADNAFKIFDEGDVTKVVAFQASGIATGTTRTLTVPDGDGTLILATGLAGGQTLIGGTASGEDLTLQSTAHATKGSIFFGAAQTSFFNEVDESLTLTGTITIAGVEVAMNVFSLATSMFAIFHSYSTTSSHRARFSLHKSHSATEADVATIDGETLGSFDFAGTDTAPGSQLAAAIIATQDGAATATRVPAVLTFGTSDGSAVVAERLRIGKAGALYINDTANAFMTIGLTIQQGANDDEIIAFKSSDVAHGITSRTDTNTFGALTKVSAALGGLRFQGYSEGVNAVQFWAIATTENTTKSAAAEANIVLRCDLKTGTTSGAHSANANIFAIKDGSNVRFLVDADGDLFADGGTTTTAVTVYDDEDDMSLVRAFDMARHAAGARGLVRSKWDEFVTHNEADLVGMGILGAPLSKGGLTNFTRLAQLHNGAIWKLHERIAYLEQQLLEA